MATTPFVAKTPFTVTVKDAQGRVLFEDSNVYGHMFARLVFILGEVFGLKVSNLEVKP